MSEIKYEVVTQKPFEKRVPKVGDIYRDKYGCLYILAQVLAFEYALISIENGSNRFEQPTSDINQVFGTDGIDSFEYIPKITIVF